MKILSTLVLLQFLLIGVCFAEDRPSNELPMYGGADKSHIEPDKKSSKGVAQLGWQYFAKGDYDTAIKRFNQAWMFDHDNIDALWGFGLIMGQRATQEEPEKNFKESIRCLNLALSLTPKNGRLIADLAYSHTLLGSYLKSENKEANKEFSKAKELFEKAIVFEPEFPMIYANWSILEFYKENYPRARELLNQAIQLGYQPSPDFMQELSKKL